jgi:hypothetical protein
MVHDGIPYEYHDTTSGGRPEWGLVCSCEIAIKNSVADAAAAALAAAGRLG